MNIEFLRNFVKLTHYKSFSELAKDLSISQSTLSHQISQLEREFKNIKLIDRTTRSFELTREGEILLTYAEKILKLYDSCREELLESSKILAEDIFITASTLPGSHILPKFIMNFKKTYPDANIKISINNSKESIDLLNKGMINFAGIGSFMDYNRDLYEVIEIGVDILNPIQVSSSGMDTDKLEKEFGDDISFWGGGCEGQHILPYGTPSEVREEVKRRIDDLAKDGGFIFSAVHNIQDDVPPENIVAMFEAFEEFRSY